MIPADILLFCSNHTDPKHSYFGLIQWVTRGGGHVKIKVLLDFVLL